MSPVRSMLLDLGQREGEKERGPFSDARRMNAPPQTAGQLAVDRKPSTPPDGLRCRPIVSDNGSAPEPIRRGRGLTIVGELASSLGGRVHTSCVAEGASFLLTFPLTEVEQHAADRTHLVQLK